MAPDRQSLTELHRSTDDTTGDPIAEHWIPEADGAGGLRYVNPSIGVAGAGMTPYYIPDGDTFTVPLYKQALFSETIDGPGILDVVGLLIEVD